MLKMFNNRARAHLLQQQSPQAVSKAKSLTIHAKVTRADGTVEPKRIVSYGHRNIVIHLLLAPLAYLNGAFWNRYYTRTRRKTS